MSNSDFFCVLFYDLLTLVSQFITAPALNSIFEIFYIILLELYYLQCPVL